MTRYVLSAPTPWIVTSPGKPANNQYHFWCGGSRWSDNILHAAAFASHEFAQEHVDALNLRAYAITAVNLDGL